MKKAAILLVLLTQVAPGRTQYSQSFKDAVVAEAVPTFIEIFFNNTLIRKKNVTTAFKNATLGALASSALHQGAWRILENPKYALLAQTLFQKGDDIKLQLLQGKSPQLTDLMTRWRLRYLFVDVDLTTRRASLNPNSLVSPLTTVCQGLIYSHTPKFNPMTSLKTGTFFFGNYRAWHRRQLVWGGRIIRGQR